MTAPRHLFHLAALFHLDAHTRRITPFGNLLGKIQMRLVAYLMCVLLAVSACASGGGEDKDTVMPNLTAERLDVALSDLARAGYDEEPEVLGGGTFGIVDESNWTVCDQEPAAGDVVSGTPRLTVERACDEQDAKAGEGADGDEASKGAGSTEPKPKKKKHRRPQTAETFVMPALVGANLQGAQDALQALGSFLLTQNDATGQGRFQVLDRGWKVCAQIPAAGLTVSFARMVDLRVVKLDESCP